jgi:hypothetical protein
VGGYGAVSQYAGKGSYELGNFGGFNLKTIPLKKERLTFVSPEKTALIRKALVNLRAVEKQTPFEKQLFIPISNQIIQTKPMIREKEKLLELIATGQKQKQIEIQKQKVISIPRNIIKNIAKTRFIPTRRIIIPSLPSGNNISKKYAAIKDKLLGGIIPQVRRFGKWMDIGKPTTYKEAFRKAISYTKSTLGASFRLKKGEELLPLERLPSEFGLSKSSKFVGVQKIGKRLSAGSEVKEIMSFKNSEGRRKLLSI